MLTNAVAVFSGLSAVCWLLSTVAWVRNRPEIDAQGWTSASIEIEGGGSFSATAALQNRWNAAGAGCACVAALCQAVAAIP